MLCQNSKIVKLEYFPNLKGNNWSIEINYTHQVLPITALSHHLVDLLPDFSFLINFINNFK